MSHKFSQAENLHNYFCSRVMWRKRNRIIETHFCANCSLSTVFVFGFGFFWLMQAFFDSIFCCSTKNRWLKVCGFCSKQQLILANNTGLNLHLNHLKASRNSQSKQNKFEPECNEKSNDGMFYELQFFRSLCLIRPRCSANDSHRTW